MNDLPDPLTPADCDLRGLPFMHLDVVRLMDSDLFALSTGDEFKAAVALWCKSWLQVPAASLPDDDRVLAHLSSAGTRWKKLKSMALRGWVKCSDGRLYHPTVAEKALSGWKARIAQRDRAAKRWQKSEQSDGNATASGKPMPRHSHGTSHGNALGRERESKEDTLTSFVTPGGVERAPDQTDLLPVPPPSAPPETRPESGSQPPDARKLLFSTGLLLVRRLTGKPEGPTRALIGKWLKTTKDDAALVAAVVGDAADLRPADPIAWIEKSLRQRSGSQQDRLAVEWALNGRDMDAEADRFAEEDGF